MTVNGHMSLHKFMFMHLILRRVRNRCSEKENAKPTTTQSMRQREKQTKRTIYIFSAFYEEV
jgi:hypothetical protein